MHASTHPESPILLPLDEPVLDRTVGTWKSGFPDMGIIALLPESEKNRLPLLQKICRSRGVPLSGAIFPEILAGDVFAGSGVWLLRMERMIPAHVVPDMGGDPLNDASRIAALARDSLMEMNASGQSRPTLYLVVDALLPRISTMLDELYLQLADQVDYAGIAAGSETFQPMPCIFDADNAYSNAALVLMIPGEVKTVLEHGFTTPERVMTATTTVGNQIVNIDWRPVFEVYRKIVFDECGVKLDPVNFYEWAVHFPFGIMRANGELVVRIPVALTQDECIHCIGEVPENAMLVVLRAPSFGNSNCAELLTEKLVSCNPGRSDSGLLLFYCAGRRMQMGGAALDEIRTLGRLTGTKTLAGALSLGEIGSTSPGGYPLFHNATLVCMPFGRR